MPRWVMHGLLIALGAALGAPLQAQEPIIPEPLPKKAPEPLPPPAPALSAPVGGCATKTIPRIYLMEVQTETTLPVLKVREVEVGRAQELVVDYREEKRTVTIMTLKPREEEQQVVTSRMEPCQEIDCTGKVCTVYKSVPCVRTVKVTVYDTVPEDRIVVVKIPCLKPGGDIVVKKLTVDAITVPAICTRFRAEHVPIEVPLSPPPCLPPLPPPPPVCPGK